MTKPTRTFEVVIAVDECKGCERCVNACPRGVLRMGTHLNKLGFPAVTLTGQPCIGCGGCFYTCPEPGALPVIQHTTDPESEA